MIGLMRKCLKSEKKMIKYLKNRKVAKSPLIRINEETPSEEELLD